MAEYIVNVGNADAEHVKLLGEQATRCFGHPVGEQIVRCRDCKYGTVYNGDHEYREPLYCGFHQMDVKPDGFCAWGRRANDV